MDIDGDPPRTLEIPIGSTGYGGGGYYVYTAIEQNLGDSNTNVRIGDVSVQFEVGTALSDPTGTWTHFAVVRNNDYFKLYINGQLIDEEKTMVGHSGADTVIDRIGAGDRGELVANTYDTEARMDEIAFFNDIKTAADIEAIYNNKVPTDLLTSSIYSLGKSGSPYAIGFNGQAGSG